MRSLLNNTIYSEGKYPGFVHLTADFLSELFETIPKSVSPSFENTTLSLNLPYGALNMVGLIGMSISSLPNTTKIKIGDKELDDIYIESKDHSKYVKFSWCDPSTEVLRSANPYYMNSSENPEEDLSWIHYISYRDEEGIFKGNILEFCSIFSFSESAENINKVLWTDFSSLIFIRPKDNPIDFTWGNIDSVSGDPYLFTIIYWMPPEA